MFGSNVSVPMSVPHTAAQLGFPAERGTLLEARHASPSPCGRGQDKGPSGASNRLLRPREAVERGREAGGGGLGLGLLLLQL